MRIQPVHNHLQTTEVTKPEDNYEDFKQPHYHFYATHWVHVELLFHSSMNCIITGSNLDCYTSIILQDFPKNAEKMHLKKANGLTNNSFLCPKHFAHCEYHTLRKLYFEIYFLFTKSLEQIQVWSSDNVWHIKIPALSWNVRKKCMIALP